MLSISSRLQLSAAHVANALLTQRNAPAAEQTDAQCDEQSDAHSMQLLKRDERFLLMSRTFTSADDVEQLRGILQDMGNGSVPLLPALQLLATERLAYHKRQLKLLKQQERAERARSTAALLHDVAFKKLVADLIASGPVTAADPSIAERITALCAAHTLEQSVTEKAVADAAQELETSLCDQLRSDLAFQAVLEQRDCTDAPYADVSPALLAGLAESLKAEQSVVCRLVSRELQQHASEQQSFYKQTAEEELLPQEEFRAMICASPQQPADDQQLASLCEDFGVHFTAAQELLATQRQQHKLNTLTEHGDFVQLVQQQAEPGSKAPEKALLQALAASTNHTVSEVTTALKQARKRHSTRCKQLCKHADFRQLVAKPVEACADTEALVTLAESVGVDMMTAQRLLSIERAQHAASQVTLNLAAHADFKELIRHSASNSAADSVIVTAKLQRLADEASVSMEVASQLLQEQKALHLVAVRKALAVNKDFQHITAADATDALLDDGIVQQLRQVADTSTSTVLMLANEARELNVKRQQLVRKKARQQVVNSIVEAEPFQTLCECTAGDNDTQVLQDILLEMHLDGVNLHGVDLAAVTALLADKRATLMKLKEKADKALADTQALSKQSDLKSKVSTQMEKPEVVHRLITNTYTVLLQPETSPALTDNGMPEVWEQLEQDVVAKAILAETATALTRVYATMLATSRDSASKAANSAAEQFADAREQLQHSCSARLLALPLLQRLNAVIVPHLEPQYQDALPLFDRVTDYLRCRIQLLVQQLCIEWRTLLQDVRGLLFADVSVLATDNVRTKQQLETLFYVSGAVLRKMRKLYFETTAKNSGYLAFLLLNAHRGEGASADAQGNDLPTGRVDALTQGRLTYASDNFFEFIRALDTHFGRRVNLHNLSLYGADLISSVQRSAFAATEVRESFKACCPPQVLNDSEIELGLFMHISDYFTKVYGKDFSKRICGDYKHDAVIRSVLKAQQQVNKTKS